MDDSPLKVVPFPRTVAEPDVVDYLERMLARAKLGEVRALAVIAEIRLPDGASAYHTGAPGNFSDLYAVMGMHQYAAHRIMLSLDAEPNA